MTILVPSCPLTLKTHSSDYTLWTCLRDIGNSEKQSSWLDRLRWRPVRIPDPRNTLEYQEYQMPVSYLFLSLLISAWLVGAEALDDFVGTFVVVIYLEYPFYINAKWPPKMLRVARNRTILKVKLLPSRTLCIMYADDIFMVLPVPVRRWVAPIATSGGIPDTSACSLLGGWKYLSWWWHDPRFIVQIYICISP